jgi:tetratricopeptide (TPR) repeat protein
MRFLSANASLCCALLFILFTGGCMGYPVDRNDENMTYFMQKVNGTQKYYDALVVSDPDNVTAWCVRGIYYNNNYGQYTEAMESCNRALELDPESGLAWYVKGVILVNTNKRDEARLCFENATKYEPALAKDLPFILGNI